MDFKVFVSFCFRVLFNKCASYRGMCWGNTVPPRNALYFINLKIPKAEESSLFETRFHCVAQDHFKCIILLPQHPEYRLKRHVPTSWHWTSSSKVERPQFPPDEYRSPPASFPIFYHEHRENPSAYEPGLQGMVAGILSVNAEPRTRPKVCHSLSEYAFCREMKAWCLSLSLSTQGTRKNGVLLM